MKEMIKGSFLIIDRTIQFLSDKQKNSAFLVLCVPKFVHFSAFSPLLWPDFFFYDGMAVNFVASSDILLSSSFTVLFN